MSEIKNYISNNIPTNEKSKSCNIIITILVDNKDNKDIKDILSKFSSLSDYFSRHNLLSEELNLQEHPSLINTNILFKNSNNKNIPPTIEAYSSGNESEEDIENCAGPAIKDVVETIYDINKIRVVSSIKDFPDDVQPCLLFFNLNLDESHSTAQKFKQWVEDCLNRYSKSINEIQQIKMINEKNKRACLMVFSSVNDLEALNNQIARKGHLFNSKGENIRVIN